MLGQVSLEACIGADLFFRETFGGNGRTCGSCHPASNNYTLDPRYVQHLPSSDPLFIAERDPELAQLEIPGLLRDHAMVVVNADGFEDPGHKFVVRSVQHLLGLAVSRLAPTVKHPLSDAHAADGTRLPIPAERLGWSGDGAPGEGRLRDFADGAITQHATRSLARRAGVDFFLPDDFERDAIATFTGSIGRMSDLDLEQVILTDEGAARGLSSFLGGNGHECGHRCHTNAGAIESFSDVFNPDVPPFGFGNVTLDIGTALVRLPAVDAAGVMLDGGHGLEPRDLDDDGELDSFGNRGFNVPPLIEAADTGPMFHTNAFETLEDAIRFYSTEDFTFSFVGLSFFPNREPGEPMPLEERDVLEIGRFLRVLNTSLNLQMAALRIEAAEAIALRFRMREWPVQRGLIELANAEVEDAFEVLAAADALHLAEQRDLRRVHRSMRALTHQRKPSADLIFELRRAHRTLQATQAALGAGLNMTLGEGTLLF